MSESASREKRGSFSPWRFIGGRFIGGRFTGGPFIGRHFIGGWNAVFTVLVFFFFVLPFLRLFWLSVSSQGSLTSSLYADLAGSARVRTGLLNTVGIVGASALLASAVGLVQAWLVAHTDLRRKRLLEGLFLMPFVIPSYITSLAWARFTGPDGFLEVEIGRASCRERV